MNRVLLVSSFLAVALVPSLGRAEAPATISANVSTFRNTNGNLGCRLFASGDGFPDKPTHVAQKTIAIGGKSATCTFSGVAPGTYAISVIHDENANGKLDRSFIGAPTEGYGVSNNKTRSMAPPTWADSKFTVAAGANVTLDITLRY